MGRPDLADLELDPPYGETQCVLELLARNVKSSATSCVGTIDRWLLLQVATVTTCNIGPCAQLDYPVVAAQHSIA